MRTLVVCDSAYGNTAAIAEAIADALGDEATPLHVSEVHPVDLASLELLVVGSPTQGGRPTQAIKRFLDEIPANALRDVGVAAFDTRFSAKEHGFALRLLMGIIGYAASRIAASLKAKGGRLVTKTTGFIVEGKEGPLKQGELERAAAWGRALSAGKSLESVQRS